jgi:hypothetical protein
MRLIPPDLGLSFAQLKGGSPSPNGTYVKLIQSKIFIPYATSTAAGADDGFFTAVRGNEDLHPPKVANDLLEYRKATEPAFKDALATTNMVVAFIGHAQIGSSNNALGLCFQGSPGDQCIVPKPLITVTLDDGSSGVLGPISGVQWDILEDGFAPKAKVVFIAACGIDANFIAQVHLQKGQALIAPVYTVPSEKLHMDLNKAAWEWQSMLLTLADGKSVTDAVAVGNESAVALRAAHRWQVIGDRNVNFRASKQ